MLSTANNEVTNNDPPALQIKRPLTPIDQYAKQKKLSKTVIEECAKLGIIQIRKYKGNSYVVDIPNTLSNNNKHTLETFKINEDKTLSQKISNLLQDPITEQNDSDKKTQKNHDQNITPGAISNLVNKMYQNASSIINEPLDLLEKNETISRPDKKPESNLSENILTSKDSDITMFENISQPEYSTDLQKSRSYNKPVVTLLITSLIFISLAAFWLYMDRKIQLEKLHLAKTQIQRTYLNVTQNKILFKRLNQNLQDNTTQITQLQNQLKDSREEVKNIRIELALSRKNFEAIQLDNANLVKILDKQLSNLADTLSRVNDNQQSPPGYDIMEK